MPMCIGDYAMDRVSRMMDEDDAGEIPWKVLFKKNSGDFARLDEGAMEAIFEFIPLDQTAFGTLFAPKPATFLEVVMLRNLGEKALEMAVRIMEIGINQGTYVRLRWLAAEGPQPPHANIDKKLRNM